MPISRLNIILFCAVIFGRLWLQTAAAQNSNTYLQALQKRATEEKLADSVGWKRLLHFRGTMWGREKSEIDGLDFFLSKQKSDAEAELNATLNAFFAPGPDDDNHAQCRYPARLLFLARKLSFDVNQMPQVRCARFQNFRRRLGARSASLVFSSYYLNNPSSAFGHTFLRLNHSPARTNANVESLHAPDRYELLDYGIGYAADMTTSNPVLYAFFGLFGFFNGTWTSLPYYYKVREYNDFESRDLWSYDLNLKQNEVDLLVAHLWELGSAKTNYFYFTRNCSYEVLAALEAAAPEIHLLPRLHAHVIPSDTIRVLFEEPGFVTGVSYRPSIRTQLLDRYQRLSNAQKREFLRIIDNDNASWPASSHFSLAEQAAVLDALLDYADFKYKESLLDDKKPTQPFKQQLLRERAHLAVQSEPEIVIPSILEYPHLGHGSHRWILASGYNQGLAGFTQLQYRFAHHEFTDPETGYPNYASIEFFSLLGRFNWQTRSWWMENLTIFRVESLSPISDLQKPLSWEVKVGSRTLRDQRCSACLAADMILGGGLTISVGNSILVSGLLESEALGSGFLGNGFFHFAAGPKLKVVARPSTHWQLVFSSAYQYRIFDDFVVPTQNAQVQWNINRDLGFQIFAQMAPSPDRNDEKEMGIETAYYY